MSVIAKWTHLQMSLKIYGTRYTNAVSHQAVADPGFVKREGRESKCRNAAPSLKKSLSAGGGGGGGTPTLFFSSDFFCRHLHYGVGVPSTCQKQQKKKSAPPPKKKKKKKKKLAQKRGGCSWFGPPPLDPPLSSENFFLLCRETIISKANF